MADRDAFGNELRPTDAVAAWGSDAAPKVDTPAERGKAARVAARRTSGGVSPVPRRRGRAPRVVGLLAFLLVVLPVVASIGAGAGSSTSSVIDAAPIAVAPAVTAPTADAPAPTGLGPRSLLRPAAFADAVAVLRGTELGRLKTLRVAAERIDAQLVTSDGRLRTVQITPGGGLRTLSTSAPGFETADTLTLAGIDTGAPARLARSAAGRARRPLSAIDGLVYDRVGTAPQWTAFLKGGGDAYLADARGRIVRKLG